MAALLRKTTHTHEDINGPEKTQQLIDSRPRPYPSPVHMTKESTLMHTVIGRGFEISSKMYRVFKCDCCGFVKPGHDDPGFPTDVVFEQNNLLKRKHPAFHCSCKEVCKGSQFYCANIPMQKHWFYQQHQRHPRDLLNLPPRGKNATICNDCHNEISSHNVNGKSCMLC